MGVMLLEIICCRRCIDFQTEDEEEAILPDWLMIAIEVTNWICLWRLMMRQEMTWGGLERLVVVAIWCIQEDPSLRPSMRIVKLMLEGMVDVSAPPCTFPFSSDYWNCPKFQLQILCPCFHFCAFQHSQPENDEEAILTDWAYDCYRGHRLDKLVKNDDGSKKWDGDAGVDSDGCPLVHPRGPFFDALHGNGHTDAWKSRWSSCAPLSFPL